MKFGCCLALPCYVVTPLIQRRYNINIFLKRTFGFLVSSRVQYLDKTCPQTTMFSSSSSSSSQKSSVKPLSSTTRSEFDHSDQQQDSDKTSSGTVDGDDNNTKRTIRIDGSLGEGGGQILRNAISFAAIQQKNVAIYNIRAGRSQPGLKAQHATGLTLVADVCGGRLVGASIGSTEIDYKASSSSSSSQSAKNNIDSNNNNKSESRTILGEVTTAGSICLLLQAALPCALFHQSPCQLVLKGGTNASMAPQYDYWEHVFWPTLQKQCNLPMNQVQAQVIRRGYFPKGGGEVHVRVQPLQTPLAPIRLTDRGQVHRIYIRSFHAGKLPRHLAEAMAKAAQKTLLEKLQTSPLPQIDIDIVTEKQAVGSALGILTAAETTTGCLLAGSALGTPKKKAKQVGVEAAEELLSTLHDGGCVDEWMQDQLILFMALADGVSEIHTGSLTQHTQTAIWVAEKLSGAHFEVSQLDDNSMHHPSASSSSRSDDDYGQEGRIAGRHCITCHGIGYPPNASLSN